MRPSANYLNQLLKTMLYCVMLYCVLPVDKIALRYADADSSSNYFVGGSSTVPSGLPSAAYYQRFVGCIAYLRLSTSGSSQSSLQSAAAAAAAVVGDGRRQLVDLVGDRDVHDTLAFCDDDGGGAPR